SSRRQGADDGRPVPPVRDPGRDPLAFAFARRAYGRSPARTAWPVRCAGRRPGRARHRGQPEGRLNDQPAPSRGGVGGFENCTVSGEVVPPVMTKVIASSTLQSRKITSSTGTTSM